MGFAASQARFMSLTARKSDLELQGQFINQSRMQLANITGNLFTISSNLEPESPEAQQLQAALIAFTRFCAKLRRSRSRSAMTGDPFCAQLAACQPKIETNSKAAHRIFPRILFPLLFFARRYRTCLV